MKLSTHGDYGVRVVLELARAGRSAQFTVAELSRRISVSDKYLGNILADLKAGGVVQSTRGAGGGFSLGRAPDQITVGQVVRLMDGPVAPIPCASRTAHVACQVERCPSEEDCVLRGLWLEVRDAISEIVDRTTFTDLLERERTGAGTASGGRFSI